MLKAQHGSVKDQRNLSCQSGSCSLSSLKPLSSPHWTHSLFESRSSYATHAYLDLLVHPKFDSNCPTSQLGLQAWVIVRGSVTGSLSSFVLTFQQHFFLVDLLFILFKHSPLVVFSKGHEEDGDSSFHYHLVYLPLLLVDLGMCGWWSTKPSISIPALGDREQAVGLKSHHSPTLFISVPASHTGPVQISMQLPIWSFKLNMTPMQLTPPSLSDHRIQLFLKYTPLCSLCFIWISQSKLRFFLKNLFTCSLSLFFARM